MKSIKKYLSACVVMAIALFASVQIAAMEPGRRVNPYLSYENKNIIKHRIDGEEAAYQRKYDPKSPYFNHEMDSNTRNYLAARDKATIDAYKEIYYGREPYNTNDEINKKVISHRSKVKPETYGLK